MTNRALMRPVLRFSIIAGIGLILFGIIWLLVPLFERKTDSRTREEFRSFEFLVDRTFHKPVKMFVTVTGDTVTLRTKIWRRDGYERGEIESEWKRDLTTEEIDALKALVASLDMNVLKKKEDYRGLDGSVWILSFPNEKAVNLWTPVASTEERDLEEFVAFGRFMWTLSGISDEQY